MTQDIKITRDITRCDRLWADIHEAPDGWQWCDYRTPVPGDWYLSKNGNVIICDKLRGNYQKRHIVCYAFSLSRYCNECGTMVLGVMNLSEGQGTEEENLVCQFCFYSEFFMEA